MDDAYIGPRDVSLDVLLDAGSKLQLPSQGKIWMVITLILVVLSGSAVTFIGVTDSDGLVTFAMWAFEALGRSVSSYSP